MRNAAEDYKPELWFGRSRLIVNMAMSSTIDDALLSIYQEIAGDIVFPMVSGIFKEYNHDFLQAKSSGYSSEEAQCIAIGESVQLPGLADDFGPLDRSPTPPPTTENRGVSYVLIPDDFVGEAGDFLKDPVWPEATEEFEFSTADAEEAYAELEAEAAQKTKRPPDNPIAPPDNPENLDNSSDDEGNLPYQGLDDSELRDYIREQRNPNTERKTRQVPKKQPQKHPKFPGWSPPFMQK